MLEEEPVQPAAVPVRSFWQRWGLIIGFVVLLAFNFVGLRAASNNARDNRELTQQVDANAKTSEFNDCLGTNEARLAGHNALVKSGERELHQAQALQGRFEESNRLNPPTTERAVRAYENGKVFFEVYVEDTIGFAAEAVRKFDEGNPQLDCKKQEPTE